MASEIHRTCPIRQKPRCQYGFTHTRSRTPSRLCTWFSCMLDGPHRGVKVKIIIVQHAMHPRSECKDTLTKEVGQIIAGISGKFIHREFDRRISTCTDNVQTQ